MNMKSGETRHTAKITNQRSEQIKLKRKFASINTKIKTKNRRRKAERKSRHHAEPRNRDRAALTHERSISDALKHNTSRSGDRPSKQANPSTDCHNDGDEDLSTSDVIINPKMQKRDRSRPHMPKYTITIRKAKATQFQLILLLTLIVLTIYGTEAQRSVGGRGVLRRNYTGKKPVVIQHRTQDAVNYYDHENGAKIIKSSHFELDYTLGRKITFFCMAQGNPRPTITWFKDGAELYQHRFFQVHESHIDADVIKSKMEIDPTTQMDAGYYECQADNIYAIDRRGFRTDYVMINF